MYKFFLLAALAACANAGYVAQYAAPLAYGGVASTAIGSQSQSTYRSLDGSSAISQYSKAVDTAFSSVRKTDTRITNDARYLTPAYAYAAPAVAHAPVAYAAPAVAHAPVAYAAPAVAHAPVARAGLIGVAYSAAPAVAHVSYDSPIVHYAL